MSIVDDINLLVVHFDISMAPDVAKFDHVECEGILHRIEV